jgi:hypothetical protein
MQRRIRFVLATAMAMSLVFASSALAHPDHQQQRLSTEELFPGEGVAPEKQHGGVEGHLPPRQDNVRLVGKASIADRTAEGAGITGRVADVNAKGGYAYLGAYSQPTCEAGGVHVMDISDPTAPFEVEDAFIPAKTGQYVGEGVQIITYRGPGFRGDVLIHNNETCGPPAEGEPIENSSGGISLWDVTDPTDPQPLAQNVGDFTAEDGTLEPVANDTHSMFAWENKQAGKTFVALIDDEESTDVDILDITDPRSPVLVNDTLDLNEEPFNVGQDEPENLTEIFSHDLFVKRIGKTDVMSLDYWDGGYVLLDVTDPTPGNVKLIDETDFALLDEEQLARGREIAPEGNAHQSEISPRNDFIIGTDEDFAPFRLTATIASGPLAGTEFEAAQSSDTPTLTEASSVAGPTTYVGLACDPATIPAGTGIALAERGTCTFQEKLDNAAAAGYTTVIVFNSQNEDCLSLLSPLAASETVPFFFIDRATGLGILGQDVAGEAACTTPTAAAIGTVGAEVSIRATFDGWGYVRLFATNLERQGGQVTADQQQIDTYAIPESQDPRFAVGFGDLSVHEVAIDPRRNKNLAYFSYYAGGFRVAEYGEDGLTEVGAFIDEGGNNFWGVQVHKIKGEYYVLASDRDYGLYIFQYHPRL